MTQLDLTRKGQSNGHRNRLSTGLIHIAIFASLFVTTAASYAASSDSATACQFNSLSEHTRNSALARASYSALQWVEYEEKSERLRGLVRAIGTEPGVTAAQAATVGFLSLSALKNLTMSHPLHRCFEEAFLSNQTLDTYFPDIVFVKGRLALYEPYAMVIPKNLEDPVVLILPTSMYRLQRTTGNLRVFDKQRQEYVDVDPQARRGLDHLIHSNLAKLQNQSPRN
jgi:hypothetical protein